VGKLLQRLSDASKSGVYRAPRADEILEAAGGGTLRIARIDLAQVRGKESLMQHIAHALEFPRWFGGNWDALEDCLTDLSWSKSGGHVLLIEGAAGLPGDELGILVDILASAASWWAERNHPFFAVFVDGEARPAGHLPAHLPDLFRSSK
jgi:Barstar (barnase inhibitor)